jgi:rhodanese-related sulfurtransferase
LATKGYTNVYRYEDGLKDWLAAGFPAEGTNPQEPAPKHH